MKWRRWKRRGVRYAANVDTTETEAQQSTQNENDLPRLLYKGVERITHTLQGELEKENAPYVENTLSRVAAYIDDRT